MTARKPLVGTFLLISSVAFARPAHGAAPAPTPGAAAAAPAAPASAPAPRKELTIPQGFKVITVNGRRAIVEPPDEQWVSAALGKVAASQPSTAPASMLQKLRDQRETLIRQMMADLGLTDPVPIAKAYDNDLTGAVRQLESIKPPIFFLVATPERMTAILKAGWNDPSSHFYYNRAADAITFNPSGLLASDKPMDDIALPAPYAAGDSQDKRADSVMATIMNTETAVSQAIQSRANDIVGSNFAQMINNLAIEPLKLKDEQSWIGVGITQILAAKYTAPVIGIPRERLVGGTIFEDPNNPLKMTAINLMSPADLKLVRPEAIMAYIDTFRRKSARAVQYLVQQGGGDGAITKALNAVREKKPADAAAVLQVIKDATGVDEKPAM